MTKLTDTQSIVLASAANRSTGSLLPLPSTLRTPPTGLARSLAALVSRGLAEERETSDAALVHRTDEDLRFGLFITPAGLAALGVEAADNAAELITDVDAPASAPSANTGRRAKASLVLALVQRESGATLAELIEATGWLPHTTRAALTGLRRKGVVLEKSKRDGATCYRAVAA